MTSHAEPLPSLLNRIYLTAEHALEIQYELDVSMNRARQAMSGSHDTLVDCVELFAEATRKVIAASLKGSGLTAARKKQREIFHDAKRAAEGVSA
jgi:hypothetical protein